MRSGISQLTGRHDGQQDRGKEGPTGGRAQVCVQGDKAEPAGQSGRRQLTGVFRQLRSFSRLYRTFTAADL